MSQVVSYRSSHRNFVCISYFSRGCYIKHAHIVEESNWTIAVRNVFKYQYEKHPSFAWRIVWARMVGLSAVNLWRRACRTDVGVEFCASWNWVYMWFKCACIYKGVQQKFKILHTRTWNRIGCSMIARPPVLSSAIFFRHLRLIPARKNLARVSKILFHFIFLRQCSSMSEIA